MVCVLPMAVTPRRAAPRRRKVAFHSIADLGYLGSLQRLCLAFCIDQQIDLARVRVLCAVHIKLIRNAKAGLCSILEALPHDISSAACKLTGLSQAPRCGSLSSVVCGSKTGRGGREKSLTG